MKLDVYLDESGNSGSNYLEIEQPFYVLGGWIIQEGSEEKIANTILTWEGDLKRQTKNEIKSSTLLKKRDGLSNISDLVSRLIKHNAWPLYCIQEKRFGLCALLTTTIFNSHPLSEHLNEEAKIVLANNFYNVLPTKLLHEFATSINSQASDLFYRFIEELMELLNSSKETDHLYIAVSMMNQEEAMRFAFSGDKKSNSINLSVFNSMLNMVECFANDNDYKSWRIFHDKTTQFEGKIQSTFESLNNNSYQRVVLSNGFELRFGDYSLSSITFVDSETNPLIRACDYYAGTLNFLLKNISAGDSNDSVSKKDYQYFLEPFLAFLPDHPKSYPALYFATISTDITYKILSRVKS